MERGFALDTGFGYERLEVYNDGDGWYFGFGQPGCLFDGEPEGPFDTAKQAYECAREMCPELPTWRTLKRWGLV